MPGGSTKNIPYRFSLEPPQSLEEPVRHRLVSCAKRTGLPPEDFAASDPGRSGEALLAVLLEILTTSLQDIAARFSALIAPCLPHSAFVMLTVDDVGHPQKKDGHPAIITRIVFSELDAIRATLSPPGVVGRDESLLSGEVRPVFVALAGTGALLWLIDPGPTKSDELVFQLWQILALHVQQHAKEASPTYLMASSAASSVRGEAVAELTNHHSNTLESLLAVLRSTSVDDRASRQTVTNLAAEATAHLRTATDRVRAFTEEPVTTAFERLRDDLRPLVRYRDIGMQFVEPPADGRALPSEVAHGARAVVSGAILASVDQASVTRVRAVWDCDGKNLLVNVRDDGPGDLSTESVQLQPLRQRVAALEASCRSPQPRAGGRRCR